MNVELDLLNACREWRRLAEAEGESMAARNWKFVAACQTALAGLQPRINQLLQSARQEWSRSGEAARRKKEDEIRTVLGDLIRLEKHNAALLVRLQRETGEQARQTELSGRNLQKIQRSYAGSPPAARCFVS